MKTLTALATFLLLAPLSLAAKPTPRIVYDNARNGGEVLVQGLAHVVYLGDVGLDRSARPLRTAWRTKGPRGQTLGVVVLEAREKAQEAKHQREEHKRLVAETLLQFPPVTR